MKTDWEVKTLGEVCKIIGGGTPSKANNKFYGGTIPWATVRDMRSDFIDETEHKITNEALKNSSTNIVPKNNVIIATRVGLGKICFVRKDTAINQDLKGVVPINANQLFVGYLFQWFKSIADSIEEEGTGATVQGVKLSFIQSLKIPLPPLAEQQRIVAILDEAFAAIDTAKANAERNLQNARALFDAYLQSVFANPGEGWEIKKVKEVAKHSLGKMLDKAKNQGVPQKYLRNINVRWFNVDLSDLLEMRFKPEESEKYTARKGDILICEGGYPGRAAIWAEDYPIYFQKAIHRVRFNKPEYNRLFLYFLFLSNSNGNLKSYCAGAGIQHFTGEALGRFLVPLPPVSETQAIVAKLDALSVETQKLEAIYRQKLADLEELKKAILQKAFRGELSRQEDEQPQGVAL